MLIVISPVHLLLSAFSSASSSMVAVVSPQTSVNTRWKSTFLDMAWRCYGSPRQAHLEMCGPDPVFTFMEFKRPSRLRSCKPSPLPLGRSPPATYVWVSLLPLCATGYGPKRENACSFLIVAPFSTSLQRQHHVEPFT